MFTYFEDHTKDPVIVGLQREVVLGLGLIYIEIRKFSGESV